MGSFNMVCAISRVSISPGDRVVLIPATKDWIYKEEGETECMIFPPSHIYFPSVSSPGSGLAPVTLPIRGTYNDYGRIVPDEDPEHDALIQKAFGVTLNEIAEFAVDGLHKESKIEPLLERFPGRVFGVYILEEVYDAASVFMPKRGRGYWSRGLKTFMLEPLGFAVNEVTSKANVTLERIYTHPILSEQQIYIIEKHGRLKFFKSDPLGNNPIQILENCFNRIESLKEAMKELYNVEFSFSPFDSMPYEEIRIRQIIFKCHRHKALVDTIMDNKSPGFSLPYSGLDQRTWYCTNHIHMSELYLEALMDGNEELLRRTINYANVRGFMFDVHAMLFPAVQGPQCGEYESTLFLGNLISKISSKVIERRKE